MIPAVPNPVPTDHPSTTVGAHRNGCPDPRLAQADGFLPREPPCDPHPNATTLGLGIPGTVAFVGVFRPGSRRVSSKRPTNEEGARFPAPLRNKPDLERPELYGIVITSASARTPDMCTLTPAEDEPCDSNATATKPLGTVPGAPTPIGLIRV